MVRFIFLTLAVLISVDTFAQKIQSQSFSGSAKQYSRSDFEVTVAGNFKNPFDSRAAAMDLVMTSPSGKKITLPCFYEKADNNNSVWKARFAPQESGKYSYSFRLSVNGKVKSTSPLKSFEAAASDGNGFLHKNDWWTFKFDSGKPFRGIGENVCWESRSFEDPKWTYDYLLPTLSNNHANFFRTWMCVWNLPVAWPGVDHTKRYQSNEGPFNFSGIKRMDEFVDLCDSLGLYVMLSIDPHGAFIPSGEWKNNPYNKANGGPAATPSDFFTNAEAKAMYKNRLRYLVARWGYSPSIAAWEFFNEIDNAVFTPTPHDSVLIDHKFITSWHDEMSTYLKSTDPYHHIITTSVSHRDIKGMNDLPNIDLNQKHIYNKTQLIVPTIHEYIKRHNKPYVIGEFGYDWNWDNVKHEYGTNFEFDYKRGLWYGLFSPTPILPMTWWWEYFDERKMTPYFKNVRAISDRMMEAGNGSFDTVSVKSNLSDAYAVRCGSTYFVYALNNHDAQSGYVNIKVNDGKEYRLTSYNPSEGIFSKEEAITKKDGMVTIKNGYNVHEDRIFILTPSDDVRTTRAGNGE